MLNLRHQQSGFTLVELLIGIVIVGVLFVMGAPAFSGWMQNSRIRTTAEAIQNGLQLARAEAVRRNTQLRFQLTTTVNNSCALSTTNSNWVISFDDPTSLCAQPPLNDAYSVNDSTNNPAPRIIQVRSAAEGSSNVIVAAGQSTIIFNGLGRVTPVPAGNVVVSLSYPGVACAPGGSMRCLHVEVSTGGQIRMCDPALSSSDPQGC